MTGAVLARSSLSWLSIMRLGLVQTALGSIVVLTTSTMNRVMVVELSLPAMLPGALVGFHYAVQLLRPRWGHASDGGRARTPWIVGGMSVLAAGGILAAVATAWMSRDPVAGTILAVAAFALIGGGVGAAGTSLLVLLATQVSDRRRAAAATIVWVMMILGFVVTASVAGGYLDPFSTGRLIEVTGVVAALAVAVTLAAVWGIETRPARAGTLAAGPADQSIGPQPRTRFRTALADVWSEPKSRLFAVFVFTSMLAYSAQDLVLEPFAGAVFGMTPGESTKLSGLQHAGVLVGMLLVALCASALRWPRRHALQRWTIAGCVASAVALAGLAGAGYSEGAWPLRANVFALGVANGAFAVAAIGAMMALVRSGHGSREGVRMGLWGAAQAVAFGLGGFAGTAIVDLMRAVTGGSVAPYATVFAIEALLFLVAARLALRVGNQAAASASSARPGRRVPSRSALAPAAEPSLPGMPAS